MNNIDVGVGVLDDPKGEYMNIAVINFKKISKSFVKLIIFVVFISLLIKILLTNVTVFQNIITFDKSSFLYTSFFTIGNEKLYEPNYVGVLEGFCPLIVAANIDKPKKESVEQHKEIIQEEHAIVISKEATTESVTDRNLAENYNMTYGNVKIRNQSDCEITEALCNPSDLALQNAKTVLIYHTHTCESYTPSEKYNYTMTGNYRTTDNNYNMVRVGNELKKYLEEKGFTVIHNTTCHDYPAYSGSYDRSFTTIQGVLNENANIGLVIDLHRDAVGDGTSYGPTVKVNGESVAQLMFVIGTNGGGLEHPNWMQNLKTAVKIQETGNTMYQGLFRPMIVRNSRYNQHIAQGASIIEVGATGNTLEECLLSMQCLANVLDEAF